MNVKTALLGLFVALTIAFASTTVYESGGRTTLTSTSSLTQTTTETTTITSTTVSTTSVVSVSTATVTKSAAFVLSVSVDRLDYTANQPILVNGSVSPAPNAPLDVNLIVANPSGLAITATSQVSAANGSYSYTLTAGGSSLWVTGVYRVTAICVAFGTTETATTQFAYAVSA